MIEYESVRTGRTHSKGQSRSLGPRAMGVVGEDTDESESSKPDKRWVLCKGVALRLHMRILHGLAYSRRPRHRNG